MIPRFYSDVFALLCNIKIVMRNTSMLLLFILAMCFQFVQAQVPSATAWLRADSVDLSAAVWEDVSGNGFHAATSAGTLPAEFSLMNFNNCFELANGEYFSLPVGTNGSRQADVIVVYETYDSTMENALWQLQLDSAKRVGQTTRRILNDNGQIIYDSINRMKPVINYLAQSWRTPETTSPTLTLCMADSLPLNGKIAEALYFDQRISDTAVIQWISYLAVKYGITLAQTDYLDSRKNVIWNYTDYPDYCATIAGVGRDDSTGLYQKQTYYADGQIIMGVGSLANTNEENNSIIADGDFLIMGMDSSALQHPVELYIQSGETYEVIGRSMMQTTGDVMTYNTFLWLDTNVVKDTVVPVLMIDRSGSGDFPAWETDMVWPSRNDSLGYFIYDNVHWDTDMNGQDAFCLVVRMPEEEASSRMAAADNPYQGSHDGIDERSEKSDRQNQKRDSKAEQAGEGFGSVASNYLLLPNPNHGKFTVEIVYPMEQDVTVTVYASDGKKVMVMSGKGQSNYRFVGQMETSGHYLIDIVSDMERKTLKMVVN